MIERSAPDCEIPPPWDVEFEPCEGVFRFFFTTAVAWGCDTVEVEDDAGRRDVRRRGGSSPEFALGEDGPTGDEKELRGLDRVRGGE